ncbi:alcohol oxidase-like protein [Flagelloscypha sp. PMI_526]|nr:alcohol oxidase-like protein [Flagelloscypha sp. PMI_526]
MPSNVEEEYDVIFAGGGTAACITAGRTAAQFPHLRILLLEKGPSTENKLEHIQPGQFSKLLATSPALEIYSSDKSPHVNGKQLGIFAGKCVGGGSSVNCTQYNLPAKSDLDAWEVEYNNPGWGSENLIPLMRKMETWMATEHGALRGTEGPLIVSYGPQLLDIGTHFMKAGASIDKSVRPLAQEANNFGPSSVNVFYPLPKWISPSGRRSDAAHHYIYNSRHHERNIHLIPHATVLRVHIEDARATGVEFSIPDQTPIYVRAKHLVVVSAGALGSPLILERSGIGSQESLRQAGVDVVVDLPGVGENYQDHPLLLMPYKADDSVQTYDALTSGDHMEWKKEGEKWKSNGTGLLGTNGVDAAIKLRPLENELAHMPRAFMDEWNRKLNQQTDKPLLWLCPQSGSPFRFEKASGQKFSCASMFLAHPISKGRIHIRSNSAEVPPRFECEYLSNEFDVLALQWGYKKTREIFQRMACHRGIYEPAHPHLPCIPNPTLPVNADEPETVYTEEEDKVINEWIRNSICSASHSLGTCAMKPRDTGGVVDSRLNVYGVQGLKVVDLSIAPSNVTSNTYSTAAVIGEKAAMIIAEDLQHVGCCEEL